MGHNVLTSRSFQVLLTEMGLPIHPAPLRAHTPKAMPPVVVTTPRSSAWPRGEALCAGAQQHRCLSTHQISLRDSHTRALLRSPTGTCRLFRKSYVFYCCICNVKNSLGHICSYCNYN